jgi:hypothetical protein
LYPTGHLSVKHSKEHGSVFYTSIANNVYINCSIYTISKPMAMGPVCEDYVVTD